MYTHTHTQDHEFTHAHVPLLDLERGEGLQVVYTHTHEWDSFQPQGQFQPWIQSETVPPFPSAWEDITPEQTSVLLYTCTKPY